MNNERFLEISRIAGDSMYCLEAVRGVLGLILDNDTFQSDDFDKSIAGAIRLAYRQIDATVKEHSENL